MTWILLTVSCILLWGSTDILYKKALILVQTSNTVSTSYIQRELRIGYNKAASLIDRMEKECISKIPVVDKQKYILGIISTKDNISKSFIKRFLLSEISVSRFLCNRRSQSSVED